MIIIIMGIAGSGKTTIGRLLAENMQMPFYDADDFHPTENVEKMLSNTPLSDQDRNPWLKLLRDKIEDWEKEGGAILACSALKESYRKVLQEKVINIKWVFLKGSKKMIGERMTNRIGHYMKYPMLESQLRDLEIPDYAITIDAKESPEHIIQNIRTQLKI